MRRAQQLALLAGWGLLFRKPLSDLVVLADRESFRLNLLLAVALLALCVRAQLRLSPTPRLRTAPVVVLLAASIAHLVLQATVDISLLSGAAMVVAAWGLAGLFVGPARWRQALPFVLAGVCVLPLGPALDTYVGFPLRRLTADLTQAVLAPLGIDSVTAETIVMIEGRGVQIDLPCSGVRSLWSGAIFWTAASWIDRRRVGLRWIGAGLAFITFLLAANFARVVALVALHRFAPEAVVAMLHLPLGLIAFVAACAGGWGLLRLVPKAAAERDPVPAPPDRRAWVLVGALLAGAALPTTVPPILKPPDAIALPAPFEPVAFTAHEEHLFATRGADAVGKWRFDIDGHRGSLLMVVSDSPRAQHPPDMCHHASGRRVATDEPVLVREGFPARRLRLLTGAEESTAFYWFQSPAETTGEHAARVWAAYDGAAEPFVMVSIAFTTPPPDAEAREVLLQVHALAQEQLP